eukprot:TRINITY_DN29011_c0_g1_i1.p2 TRINITY_DN29011_c0_g1~~TRINITY_DN29011_c0_g1_i1.p2  ORF type:complete len:103 (+),score=2.45 TRINITY_DN29011_c0_g1_i1:95-403(+)
MDHAYTDLALAEHAAQRAAVHSARTAETAALAVPGAYPRYTHAASAAATAAHDAAMRESTVVAELRRLQSAAAVEQLHAQHALLPPRTKIMSPCPEFREGAI